MTRSDLIAYKDLVDEVKAQRPTWRSRLIYGNGTDPLYEGLGIDVRFCRNRDNFTRLITPQPVDSFRDSGVTVLFLNMGIQWPIVGWALWSDPRWTWTYQSNRGVTDWEIPQAYCRRPISELEELIQRYS